MENDSVSRVYCAHVTVMLHVHHSHMIGHMTTCMHNLWAKLGQCSYVVAAVGSR